ncbi:hypothetical protein CIB95_04670 [Lottiidibacillus patelloidae]|uniref:Uncharacterized protein n=1 Tax=Lottiidibacillus patelloidae TaxID=2670334 RepID=A0A263BWG6_9BACI|nr:hypothetical protein [Lottiidibacillus patelloidae]OZM57667.1 hypothetical protein CIB95_04670 [Lottiidibacillus patelloidae]
MEKRYGGVLPEESESQISNIFDRDDELLIFKRFTDMESIESEMEETYTLIQLQAPILKSTFSDYGFVSPKANHYLYDDMVRGFTIRSEHKDNIKMALFQIEEHLIAVENAYDQPIYFVDKKLSTLIEKYKLAYEVEIIFIT